MDFVVLYYLQLATANRILKGWRVMTLLEAETGREYIIKALDTGDEELESFLFSLGCYTGEPITVIARQRKACTVSIKDGRYNIDSQLAEAIII